MPLDPEILDHRIGEQLAAHRLDVGVAGAVGEVELDQLAGADVLDAGEAEALRAHGGWPCPAGRARRASG